MKQVKREEYIVCPKCGREYLPCEIYYPKHFFGTAQEVDRFSNGKIDCHNGKPMDLEETYVCDHCDTKFRVTATIKFKTTEITKHDMSKAYVTPLFDEKITLSEGN